MYSASLSTKIQGALMDLVPEGLQAKMHDDMTKPQSEK